MHIAGAGMSGHVRRAQTSSPDHPDGKRTAHPIRVRDTLMGSR